MRKKLRHPIDFAEPGKYNSNKVFTSFSSESIQMFIQNYSVLPLCLFDTGLCRVIVCSAGLTDCIVAISKSFLLVEVEVIKILSSVFQVCRTEDSALTLRTVSPLDTVSANLNHALTTSFPINSKPP